MTQPAETVRLDQAVVERGILNSRTRAARAIASGLVSIDGIVVRKASTPVAASQIVFCDEHDQWVSRAAYKLEHAFRTWNISVNDATVLDVGASTGGFTQVALAHGARRVIALDVGRDQLHPTIRNDDRVDVVEGENARYVTAERLAELSASAPEISLVVSDVSFISLTMIIPALVQSVGAAAGYVFLVKPQFEVGRSGIDGGIVRNATKRQAAIRDVVDCAIACGLTVSGLTLSPVSGEHGNIEAILYCDSNSPLDAREWSKILESM
ncbi:MAG: hypothetical protein RIS25_1138 [Actinomycetota bacterium]|jgi:23S rRNA (cytidine1920-2'-O)/16S rRNA (cytidine1409-2'-O)-methyltransferase